MSNETKEISNQSRSDDQFMVYDDAIFIFFDSIFCVACKPVRYKDHLFSSLYGLRRIRRTLRNQTPKSVKR